MKSQVQSEEGLSLVEVLASIVILGIVFVGLTMILPQMALFNKKTEIKLETMNLARQEIALIKMDSYSSPLSKDEIHAKLAGTISVNPSDLSESAIRINYHKSDYQYEVDFFTDEIPGLGSENYPENIVLYKVHLKVLADGKQNSESFGYIEANK